MSGLSETYAAEVSHIYTPVANISHRLEPSQSLYTRCVAVSTSQVDRSTGERKFDGPYRRANRTSWSTACAAAASTTEHQSIRTTLPADQVCVLLHRLRGGMCCVAMLHSFCLCIHGYRFHDYFPMMIACCHFRALTRTEPSRCSFHACEYVALLLPLHLRRWIPDLRPKSVCCSVPNTLALIR